MNNESEDKAKKNTSKKNIIFTEPDCESIEDFKSNHKIKSYFNERNFQSQESGSQSDINISGPGSQIKTQRKEDWSNQTQNQTQFLIKPRINSNFQNQDINKNEKVSFLIDISQDEENPENTIDLRNEPSENSSENIYSLSSNERQDQIKILNNSKYSNGLEASNNYERKTSQNPNHIEVEDQDFKNSLELIEANKSINSESNNMEESQGKFFNSDDNEIDNLIFPVPKRLVKNEFPNFEIQKIEANNSKNSSTINQQNEIKNHQITNQSDQNQSNHSSNNDLLRNEENHTSKLNESKSVGENEMETEDYEYSRSNTHATLTNSQIQSIPNRKNSRNSRNSRKTKTEKSYNSLGTRGNLRYSKIDSENLEYDFAGQDQFNKLIRNPKNKINKSQKQLKTQEYNQFLKDHDSDFHSNNYFQSQKRFRSRGRNPAQKALVYKSENHLKGQLLFGDFKDSNHFTLGKHTDLNSQIIMKTESEQWDSNLQNDQKISIHGSSDEENQLKNFSMKPLNISESQIEIEKSDILQSKERFNQKKSKLIETVDLKQSRSELLQKKTKIDMKGPGKTRKYSGISIEVPDYEKFESNNKELQDPLIFLQKSKTSLSIQNKKSPQRRNTQQNNSKLRKSKVLEENLEKLKKRNLRVSGNNEKMIRAYEILQTSLEKNNLNSLRSSKSFQNLYEISKQKEKLKKQKTQTKFDPSKDLFFDPKVFQVWDSQNKKKNGTNKKNNQKGKKKFKNPKRKITKMKRSKTTHNIKSIKKSLSKSKIKPEKNKKTKPKKILPTKKSNINFRSQNFAKSKQISKSQTNLTPRFGQQSLQFSSKNKAKKVPKKKKTVTARSKSINTRKSLNMKGRRIKQSKPVSVISIQSFDDDINTKKYPPISRRKSFQNESHLLSSEKQSNKKEIYGSPNSKHNRRSSLNYLSSAKKSDLTSSLSNSNLLSRKKTKSSNKISKLIPNEIESQTEIINLEESQLIRSIPNKIQKSSHEKGSAKKKRFSKKIKIENSISESQADLEIDESTNSNLIESIENLAQIEDNTKQIINQKETSKLNTSQDNLDFEHQENLKQTIKNNPKQVFKSGDYKIEMNRTNCSFYIKKLKHVESSDKMKLKMDQETYKNLSPKDQNRESNPIKHFETENQTELTKFTEEIMKHQLLSTEKNSNSAIRFFKPEKSNPRIPEIIENSDFFESSPQKDIQKSTEEISLGQTDNSISNLGIVLAEEMYPIHEESDKEKITRESQSQSNFEEESPNKEESSQENYTRKSMDLKETGFVGRDEQKFYEDKISNRSLDKTNYFSMNEGNEFPLENQDLNEISSRNQNFKELPPENNRTFSINSSSLIDPENQISRNEEKNLSKFDTSEKKLIFTQEKQKREILENFREPDPKKQKNQKIYQSDIIKIKLNKNNKNFPQKISESAKQLTKRETSQIKKLINNLNQNIEEYDPTANLTDSSKRPSRKFSSNNSQQQMEGFQTPGDSRIKGDSLIHQDQYGSNITFKNKTNEKENFSFKSESRVNNIMNPIGETDEEYEVELKNISGDYEMKNAYNRKTDSDENEKFNRNVEETPRFNPKPKLQDFMEEQAKEIRETRTKSIQRKDVKALVSRFGGSDKPSVYTSYSVKQDGSTPRENPMQSGDPHKPIRDFKIQEHQMEEWKTPNQIHNQANIHYKITDSQSNSENEDQVSYNVSINDISENERNTKITSRSDITTPVSRQDLEQDNETKKRNQNSDSEISDEDDIGTVSINSEEESRSNSPDQRRAPKTISNKNFDSIHLAHVKETQEKNIFHNSAEDSEKNEQNSIDHQIPNSKEKRNLRNKNPTYNKKFEINHNLEYNRVISPQRKKNLETKNSEQNIINQEFQNQLKDSEIASLENSEEETISINSKTSNDYSDISKNNDNFKDRTSDISYNDNVTKNNNTHSQVYYYGNEESNARIRNNIRPENSQFNVDMKEIRNDEFDNRDHRLIYMEEANTNQNRHLRPLKYHHINQNQIHDSYRREAEDPFNYDRDFRNPNYNRNRNHKKSEYYSGQKKNNYHNENSYSPDIDQRKSHYRKRNQNLANQNYFRENLYQTPNQKYFENNEQEIIQIKNSENPQIYNEYESNSRDQKRNPMRTPSHHTLSHSSLKQQTQSTHHTRRFQWSTQHRNQDHTRQLFPKLPDDSYKLQRQSNDFRSNSRRPFSRKKGEKKKYLFEKASRFSESPDLTPSKIKKLNQRAINQNARMEGRVSDFSAEYRQANDYPNRQYSSHSESDYKAESWEDEGFHHIHDSDDDPLDLDAQEWFQRITNKFEKMESENFELKEEFNNLKKMKKHFCKENFRLHKNEKKLKKHIFKLEKSNLEIQKDLNNAYQKNQEYEIQFQNQKENGINEKIKEIKRENQQEIKNLNLQYEKLQMEYHDLETKCKELEYKISMYEERQFKSQKSPEKSNKNVKNFSFQAPESESKLNRLAQNSEDNQNPPQIENNEEPQKNDSKFNKNSIQNKDQQNNSKNQGKEDDVSDFTSDNRPPSINSVSDDQPENQVNQQTQEKPLSNFEASGTEWERPESNLDFSSTKKSKKEFKSGFKSEKNNHISDQIDSEQNEIIKIDKSTQMEKLDPEISLEIQLEKLKNEIKIMKETESENSKLIKIYKKKISKQQDDFGNEIEKIRMIYQVLHPEKNAWKSGSLSKFKSFSKFLNESKKNIKRFS